MAERASGREPEDRNSPGNPRANAMPTLEIRYEDYLEAQRDPEVKKLMREAQAEGDALKREGLIYL